MTKRSLPVADIAIALVAVLIVFAVTYYSNRQQAETAQAYDTFSTLDPASGGYRAWYELLDREGVRVARFERRPAFVDASIDTYVMAANSFGGMMRSAQHGDEEPVLFPGDWKAIAAWVRAGGHLVWLADGQTVTDDLNAPAIRATGPKSDEAVSLLASTVTAGVDTVSGTSALRIPFADSLGATPLVGDDTGGVVASYRLGRGTVTLVTDESLFTNGRLDKADNARLALDIATAALGPHGLVAFDEWSHGYVAGDTWWSVLPRPFQAGIVLIGIALVLIAIPSAARFGPTARLPDAADRTSAAYLASMAALYRKGNAVRTAMRDLCDGCLRDVAAYVGLPETVNAKAIAQRLGDPDRDGSPAEAVMEIDRLRSYEYPHPPDLLRAAQLCARLRKEYTRHGSFAIRRRSASARRTA